MPHLPHLPSQILLGAVAAVAAVAAAAACRAPGERARGAPGFPAVPWKPCCAGGRLVARAGTWGRFCPHPQPAEKRDCYETGERAQGADGMPAAEWTRCCNAGDVQEEVAGEWGKFCVGHGAAAWATAARQADADVEAAVAASAAAAVAGDVAAPAAVDASTVQAGDNTRVLPIGTATTLPVATAPSTLPIETAPTTLPIATVTTTLPTETVPTTTPIDVNDKCEGLGSSVRKDVKRMTPAEWGDYVEAHARLRANGVYAAFSNAHGTVSRHDKYFLIWHRLMLTEWNKALNSVFPGVVQPFYDWSVMADNVFDDDIFGPDGRFGGDGQVIPDGSFAGLPVARRFRRDRSLMTATRIREVRTLPGFGDFTEQTELVHNTFHTIVGGDMLVLATAPNDFLFYMHHSFIDKMWKDWQLAGNLLKVSPSIDLDVVMLPWGKTAREVLNASDCTNYDGVSGSLAGNTVFAVDDEFVFETKSDKIAAEKEAATKLISAPEAVKLELQDELKREDDLRQASLEIGEDPGRVERAISGLREVVLKGDSSLDLNEAETVINSTTEQIVANAEQQLATLQAGQLTPSNSGLARVRNVNA